MHSRSFIMPYVGVFDDRSIFLDALQNRQTAASSAYVALRQVHLRTHRRRNLNRMDGGLTLQRVPSLITHRTLWAVCVARCNHCTWPTMHERVASCAAWPVIFISMDPLLALRQCPVPLCGIAMRRDFCDGARLDAPIHRMRYSRTSCTSPRCYHHVAPACQAAPEEGNAGVQCRRSLLRLSAKGIVLGHSHTRPFLQWSCLVSPSLPLPPLYLSKDTCPINEYNCKKRITAKPIRVD